VFFVVLSVRFVSVLVSRFVCAFCCPNVVLLAVLHRFCSKFCNRLKHCVLSSCSHFAIVLLLFGFLVLWEFCCVWFAAMRSFCNRFMVVLLLRSARVLLAFCCEISLQKISLRVFLCVDQNKDIVLLRQNSSKTSQNECLCMDQYEHRRPFCVRFGVQNESRTAATRVQNLGQIGQANLCKTNACGAICAGPGSYCLRLDLRARGARITERDTCCGVSTRLRLAGCPAPAGAVSDPSADSAL